MTSAQVLIGIASGLVGCVVFVLVVLVAARVLTLGEDEGERPAKSSPVPFDLF
jgi:hypothetical protein